MAQKKPNHINENSNEVAIINALSYESINEYFNALSKGKEFNPFFGALVFNQTNFVQVEDVINDRCSARFRGLYADLKGICASLYALSHIVENIGTELYPLAVTDISAHALIMWGLEPIETPVLDVVKADFMSLLYEKLNADTLNYFNTQLYSAKEVARSMLLMLEVEPLSPNMELVLEKYLKLI